MNRPTTFGLLALVIIGVALALIFVERPRRAAKESASPRVSNSSTRGADLTQRRDDEVMLGDVAAVPFQEIYGLLSRRSAAEIAVLAQQLTSLPRSPAAEAKVASFFKAWAALDATAAFASAKDFPKELRDDALGAVLDGVDASAAGALVLSINELPEGAISQSTKTGLLARAIGKWSQAEPAAAANFLDAHRGNGMSFSLAASEVARNWAATDPTAALAWARQSAGNGDRFALSGAMLGWWKNDPSAAEAYVATHLQTLEDRQLASALASNIFYDDPERAKKWISQLPDKEAREQANNVLAMTWGFSDPAAAANWAATLPESERATTLATSVGFWSGQDPVAAGQWLGKYNGPGRDQVVETFSSNIASKDPATALSWVATISDPKTLFSSAQRIAGDWLKQNPQAATAWIQNSSLSAEVKSQLLSPAPGR
ncbi:MAG: hypothetical protein ACR2G0_08115 [Chthoniobacterales bacterium]